ncbi:surface-adhesin E family protein [Acinetobacter sp. ANC 5378]|uniref:surface-adhesin E family protein n=1 Tax=Acinetobacter sp. ANC 5378 TaxID=2731249 RepID=UPI0014904E3A|nr:surface-adhesin E family protein [Acinetobacter sp. ANC 5378]NNG82925.1 hypothetical protein [Acinetobacter sp. ANC 5378]
MNKLILWSLLFFSVPAIAYTPKLLLVDSDNYSFKQYLDEKSIQRIDKNLMKVVVYDKHTRKISDEYAKNYQSAIKVYIVDCPYKALAMGQATYYSGMTSNSDFVGAYNNIKGMDGDTGEIIYFYDDLEFTSIKNSNVNQKIYKRVCIGKLSNSI